MPHARKSNNAIVMMKLLAGFRLESEQYMYRTRRFPRIPKIMMTPRKSMTGKYVIALSSLNASNSRYAVGVR